MLPGKTNVQLWLALVASTVFAGLSAASAWGQFQIEEHSDRIDILRDGGIVTSYILRSGTKPVLWPILGPDGHRMTRSYPLDDSVPGEDHDHPHHRGLWMTFGEVNGVDWWAEGNGKGIVEHLRTVSATADGPSARLVAEHRWLPPDATSKEQAVLLETSAYTFRGDASELIIDCEYVVRGADPKEPVHFGDTKEGMFAIRVPETMRGDRPSGELLNSVGDRGGDVWGKSAAWVDYSGPVASNADSVYGIAILIHPTTFRREGLWHARTYGLFAHNPFGIKDFLPNRTPTESGRKEAPHQGGYTLPAGESLHFMYRVIFHRGRWNADIGQARMTEFANVAPSLH